MKKLATMPHSKRTEKGIDAAFDEGGSVLHRFDFRAAKMVRPGEVYHEKRGIEVRSAIREASSGQFIQKKTTRKRELIEPHKGDKRYVRRKADGTFGKTVDVGRSLSSDKKRSAKKVVPKGQGDREDTKRRK